MCQELDMDKKDLISFFQELRIWFKNSSNGKGNTDENDDNNIKKSSTFFSSPLDNIQNKYKEHNNTPITNDDSITILMQMETIFEDSTISRLDIKRMYRYLDKNAIKDCDDSEISSG